MAHKLRALWLAAPWTLRIYVGVGEVLALLRLALGHSAINWVWVVVGLVLSYYLLKRVRWLWFVVVGVTAVYLVAFLLILRVNAIVYLIALLLLLAPATRRHFARDVATAGS